MIPTLQLRWFVVICAIGANLVVFSLSIIGLLTSRHHYEQRVDTRTQNISLGLEQAVSKSFEKIDISLSDLAYDLEYQMARGEVDEKYIEASIEKSVKSMPELEAIRVVNAEGLVYLGNADNKLARQSVVDRDYFMYLKEHKDSQLFVTEPIIGRMVKHYIIIFAKRFNYPDGKFGGVVYATIPLSHFTDLLGKFDVGLHGTIVLRDDRLRLLTRLPAIPEIAAGKIGNALVSPEFRNLFNSGTRLATFHTSQASDGTERTVTYRSLEGAPFIAIVGLASIDYLQDWWGEVYVTCGFVFFFVIVSVIAAITILRLLRNSEEREARIHALSFYDALTELPSLRLAEDRLNMALTQARRGGDKVGLMFIDLDGFKDINDAHGHYAGDQVLKEIAHRIQKTIRANDTAARIGGDEILVILGSISDRRAAQEVATKIIAVVTLPILLNGKELTVGCSIGVSLFPDDAQDAQSLRIKADSAMYSVKRSGKNNFAFYQGDHSLDVQIHFEI